MARISGSKVFVGILALLFLGAVVVAASYMLKGGRPESHNNTSASNSEIIADDRDEDAAQYLDIIELGLRLKLTENIKDTYYVPGEATSRGAEVPVYLSTRSLDTYPACAADETNRGVAVLNHFTTGYSDEVVGNYNTAYPDAPLVDRLHFYIIGNQYDCTDGQNSDLYSKARRELIDSYKTIEKIPALQ